MKTECNIIVSDTTRGFIECLVMLDQLYGKVSETLEGMYGSSYVDSVMSSKYSKKSEKIRDFICEYMCISIEENIGGVNNYEKKGGEI